VTGRLRSEGGWTLIELLVAMTLMLIVLSATLTSFNAFSNNARRSTQFNDQQDRVRNVMDQIIRQTRNLANPTTGAGVTMSTIAYADSGNLVFQTTDPQKQWVRYCLNTSTAPSTAARESIWYQTTTTATLPASAVNGTCPSTDSTWQKSTLVADYVTNQASGPPDRPLFSYFSKTGPMPTVPVPAADTTKIVRVAMSVFLKLEPNRPPAEAQLASAAYMRNQNQAPRASFDTDVAGTTYTFDGGASSDPEGRTLEYDWYTAPANPGLTVPSPAVLPTCSAKTPDFSSAPGWGCLGTTVVLTKTITTATYVFLRVTDPGNLQSMTAFPGGGCLSATSPARVPTDCGAIP
jgi:type II secretory pathway pseudopilin PulG